MGDAALVFSDSGGDLRLEGGDLVVDDGLQAAVTVSLYSDRRVSDSERTRFGLSDPRGCWWDQESFRWGSRLWLLTREKQRETVRASAEEYALEALAWMQTEGIASKIEASATWAPEVQGVLCLFVTIERGTARRWDHLWQGLTVFQGQFGGFGPGGGGPAELQLNYGTALLPTGTPLDFGSAGAAAGPEIDLGGA